MLTIFLYSSQLIFSQTLGKPQEQVCNICGKTIQGSKSKLLKHVNERHKGIKDHVCHLCGAGFSRPSTLKYHTQRIHEHSGKYACQYCEFKTVLPKHLAIHVNSVHTKEIKYSCEECNFSCYTKGNLTAHVKTVHLKLKVLLYLWAKDFDFCYKERRQPLMEGNLKILKAEYFSN